MCPHSGVDMTHKDQRDKCINRVAESWIQRMVNVSMTTTTMLRLAAIEDRGLRGCDDDRIGVSRPWRHFPLDSRLFNAFGTHNSLQCVKNN